MILFLVLTTAMVSAAEDPAPLSFEQFLAAMSAYQAEIADIELVCEGAVSYVDKEQPDAAKSKRLDRVFQCNYAYRAADQARYWDLFLKGKNQPEHDGHSVTAVLKETTQSTTLVAGAPERGSLVRNERANRGSTAGLGSPERLLQLVFFQNLIKYAKHWKYRFVGWESVDGHRCACIELIDELSGGTSLFRYWIDLERQGHALKYELIVKGDLWFNVENIKLHSYPVSGGKNIWLPVHGEYHSFLNGSTFRKTPVLEEIYDVVQGTVLINRNLRDERFSLQWKGPRSETLAIREATKKIKATPPRAAAPPLRSDPESVARDQAAKLAEAEAQAAQLDASPGAAAFGFWGLLPWLSAGIGAAFLISALVFIRGRSLPERSEG